MGSWSNCSGVAIAVVGCGVPMATVGWLVMTGAGAMGLVERGVGLMVMNGSGCFENFEAVSFFLCCSLWVVSVYTFATSEQIDLSDFGKSIC